MLIFVVSLSLRLAIIAAFGIPPEPERTEVTNIAVSLARGTGFADPFDQGTGATAHAAPVYPYLLSLLYRRLGTEQTGALAHVVFAYAISSAGYALLPVIAVSTGLPAFIGIIAGFLAAMVPVSFYAERATHEDPLTALLMLVLVLLNVPLLGQKRTGAKTGACLGVLYGCVILASPVLLTVVAAYLLIPRSGDRCIERIRNLAVTAVCIVAVLAPWAIRNYSALGDVVWLRSNLGLELSL